MLPTAQPKPKPRATEKRRKQRHARAVAQVARAVCVERDSECRIGEGWEDNPDDWHDDDINGTCDGPSEWAHLGDAKRFKTRGKPPEQRHTTAGSLMLCRLHHRAYDRGELRIMGDDANMPLRFEWVK